MNRGEAYPSGRAKRTDGLTRRQCAAALLAVGGVWEQQSSGPRLLMSAEDLARAKQLAADFSWARAALDATLNAALSWPQAHLTRYGLKELELPPEGGQWSLWDVCPVHGVSLRYSPPDIKTCPVDGRRYSGWPFDQVTFGRRHNDLAGAARDLALAWQWTGEAAFAEQAAWILKQYAARYNTYVLHDKDNRNTRGGARAHAQTLDEAVWAIPLVWAYDLLSGSGALEAADRLRIESELLRPLVQTIQRNDAGESNWQSWHNAAIGAVGFALADSRLIAEALDGKSGFRFQMSKSVTPDGFWYEGAWGYHFYALDPLLQLALMARQAGMDLFAEASLRGMFTGPLSMAFPNGALPAFNDSGEISLYSQDRLYEVAAATYGEERLAAPLGTRTRGLWALLWGLSELPKVRLEGLPSLVLADSGYAVLRAPGSAEGHTVIVKFGPHGGWHGHYDKPSFVSWYNGATMAVDPGTQSYAAPTHDTWDKVTVAHNTVVVDETTQGEATGELLWSELEHPVYRAVKVSAGPAYRAARLERTMVVTAGYALDVFEVQATDGQDHTFDWIYHNDGRLLTELPLQSWRGFGSRNGYQHLTATRATATDEAWQVRFDWAPVEVATYGAVFNSNANVTGVFQTARGEAASGQFAGRASYTFRGTGYILYSTPVITGQPVGVPVRKLSLMIRGDGSKHRLAVRLNDSTDERFVYQLGPVDWVGWKRIEAENPESWQHYLGNADGVFDGPPRTVSLELTFVGGGPATGAIGVDDIELEYADGSRQMVNNFETPLRNLRVWMLAAPETTVVTGDGLGPDLQKPVPFVLARRKGRSAVFAALLEPYQNAAPVKSFSRDAAGTFRIETADWSDTFRLTEQGVADFTRQS
ncbi:MAG: alginate lyase family protein [Acidobacteria bacterium]|nr:alginate lyase family protein [Acidobacteriota bacterium]